MWGSEDEVVRCLAGAARTLAAQGVRVRIFPVWENDVATCRAVVDLAQLGSEALEPLELDGARAVERMRSWDAVVSLKLHAAVCAAAAAVPFLAVEYRPKVRDFAASLGWERFTLRSDEISVARVVETVDTLMRTREQRRSELEPEVARLAQEFRSYILRVRNFMLS
jgi:polysaccharide pyruvyl transferase WcaK-like protein